MLSNRKFVTRSKQRPFVPLKGAQQNQLLSTNPSDTYVWRKYLKSYPNISSDTQAYINAMVHRGQMSAAMIRGNLGQALVPTSGRVAMASGGSSRVNIATAINRSWVSMGPFDFTPTPDLLTVFGPTKVAGRVNNTASDSLGNLYVATASGGIWRFDINPNFDPGNPFDPFNPRLRVDPYNATNPSPRQLTDFSFAALQTTSITIDPKNDNILYVGLGDYNLAGRDVLSGDGQFPARQSNDVTYSLGIMKSVNSGKTWANIGNSTLNLPLSYAVATTTPAATSTVFTPTVEPQNPNDPIRYLSDRTNEYVGSTITFTSGANAGLTSTVTAYTGAAGTATLPPFTFTVAPALKAAPVAGDSFTLVGYTGLEGTAVSSVLVDPDNSAHIVVTSGRGVNPGGIWYSNDAGNSFSLASWRHVNPTTNTVEEIKLPAGDYSNVDISQADTLGRRVMYASVVGVGVYRSFDRGQTWAAMDQVPLIFNVPNSGGSPYGGPQLGLKSVFSRKTGSGSIAYVFDASGGFNDGRVLKSLNALAGIDSGDPLFGEQPQWTDVTGDYPRPEGVNNFSFANYDTTLAAGQVIVNVLDSDGNPTGVTGQEALLGGQRFMGAALGAVSYNGGIFGSSATGDPIIRNDPGVGQDWTEIAEAQTHAFHHGVTFDNISPFLVFSSNDGGVYQVSSEPGFFVQPPTGSPAGTPPLFFNDATFAYDTLDPLQEPNTDFRVSEFYRADFFQTNPGTSPSQNIVSVAGTMASNAIAQGTLDFTGTTPAISWNPLNWNIGNTFINDSFSLDAIVFGTSGALNDTDNLYEIVSEFVNPPLEFGFEVDNIAFDPTDPTGQTQYMITAGIPATPWGDPKLTGNSWKSIFYTTDGWQHYLDITPNRYISDGFFDVINYPTKDGPIYIYNQIEPQDTTTPSNWTGEARPYFGMPLAFGYAEQVSSGLGNAFIPNNANPNPPFNAIGFAFGEYTADQPCLYTGGQYLWRFDPPGSLAKPAIAPGPLGKSTDPTTGPAYTYPNRVFPNQDYGVWRRIGGQQLATGTNFITAIALVPGSGPNAERIYVGTSAGDIWISQNATIIDKTSVQTNFVATSAATWKQIAGAAVTGNTLPNRPVSSLRINTDTTSTNLGDLIVSLGGAPGVPHVWRATNTTGSNTPIFTAISGQGYAALPDVPVNDLARDPDDSTNTLYAATDLGVFTSIDGGATWSNATAPLGLPNVECTSIKVVPDTPGTPGIRSPRQLYVSTFGRGVFRFDLNNIQTSNAPPNLKISQNFTRNGAELIVNVIITNSSTPPSGSTSVGTAFNVTLTTASISVGGVVTQSNSLPANGIAIGTIAPGQSETVTVRFPSSAARSGQAVFFNASGTLTLPPFPPGTPSTFDNSPGFRTRLP